MDIKDIILNRRTIHNYNNQPIIQQHIDAALECFLHAPNHKHTKPWKVLITDLEQRKQLVRLNIKLKEQKKELSEIEQKAIEKKMMSPSHLMVILQKKVESDFQSKEDYAAVSCAIMSMQLYFWSHGIGCKWSSGKITFNEETYKILNISNNDYSIVGFNWAGYFDREPKKPEKQSVSDILV